MKITYRYWNEGTREAVTNETEAAHVETYRGHEIFKDAEDWYYVFDGENWQYFDSKRNFIVEKEI